MRTENEVEVVHWPPTYSIHSYSFQATNQFSNSMLGLHEYELLSNKLIGRMRTQVDVLSAVQLCNR